MPDLTPISMENEMVEQSSAYCSLVPETIEERKTLFAAMNNPTGRLADLINMSINVKDIYCEMVTIKDVDESTGEVTNRNLPRSVLICDDGKSYTCTSLGIYNALKKLILVFGEPTWIPPIPLTIKQITKDTNKMLTIELY